MVSHLLFTGTSSCNVSILSAESPPKKRRKSLSEEEVQQEQPQPPQATQQQQPPQQSLPPGPAKEAELEAKVGQKTAEGTKSESTCDVGDSRKADEVAAPSTSGSGGASKAKNELDSRAVQLKEMERNFERILASIAVTEEPAGEEKEKMDDHVIEEETGQKGDEQELEKEKERESELPLVTMEENIEGAGTSSFSNATMIVNAGEGEADGQTPVANVAPMEGDEEVEEETQKSEKENN